LGQEFTPALDEKNIVMEVRRIPSVALSQSQGMQLQLEKAIARMPQVAFVYSRTGTPDLAADPMPPSASDAYIILKPRQEWPDPSLTKEGLIQQIEKEVATLPGNRIGFSQPIQMRFNELIAGVRDDLAVKVFGDEFEPMLRAANRIASILRRTAGAVDVRVEDVEGLPFLEIRIDKSAIARRGLSLARVQEVIGTPSAAARPGSCSKATGASRSWWRLPTGCGAISRCSRTCRCRCRAAASGPARACRCGRSRPSPSSKVPIRSAVRTASGAWW